MGWLVGGVLDPLGWVSQWFRSHGAGSWVGVALIVLVLWAVGGAVRAWLQRRRHDRASLRRLRAASLWWKEQLRLRLDEPARMLADHSHPGPTMGAREIFERDMDAATSAIWREASGNRTKAKELLRQRVNGKGAAKLNGSAALAWRQLGALSLIDNTGDALAAYARAVDLAPEDADARMLLGVLQLRAGRLDAAEAAFRHLIKMGNGQAEGASARYRGRTMLGDVLVAKNCDEEALESYQTAQAEVSALLQQEPDNAALQRELSVTHDRIGDVRAAKGDFDGALESYRSGLAIAEGLASREPANPGWQRDLSVSYDRIGDMLDRMSDLTGALKSYRQGLAIAERLARRNTEDLQAQWDLSVSCDRIGDVLIAQDKIDAALASYRRGLELAEMLVERDPRQPGWQRDLAVTYHKLGSIEAARGNSVEARDLLERGRAIIGRLDRIAAHKAQWRSDLSQFDAALQALDG